MAVMSQGVSAALTWHRNKLVNSPYISNSIQSGLLMFLGDRAAQHFEQQNSGKKYSTRESTVRSVVVTSWASSINACFWTFWYGMLARKMPPPPASSPVLLKIKKALPSVAFSLMLSPFWNSAFFTYTTFFEHVGNTPDPFSPSSLKVVKEKIRTKIENQLIPTIARSACIWVPFNIINLSLVPLEYRMVTGGLIALGWNLILSLIQHSNPEAKFSLTNKLTGPAKMTPPSTEIA